jgi:sterol 3beta-glucosyltransferase
MRIMIIAMGSRGDVQPYIALGQGLKASGHSVRLATHENFESLVNSHRLEFYPLKGNVQAFLEDPENRKILESGNFLNRLRSIGQKVV